MDDTVYEIKSHSSSEDDNVTSLSSNSNTSSQQNTPGNQSQTRRRHSLSLRKAQRANSDQSNSCVNTFIESKSRQSRLSSVDNPSAHSSAPIQNNCEFVPWHSAGQNIGNNTSSKLTENYGNHSRSQESTPQDIFDICRLNSSSQGSHSSSNISPQHEVTENRLQTGHDHSVLSHGKSQKIRREHTEQHEKNSTVHRVRKSLFASLAGLSPSSGDDLKIVAESGVSCPQNQRPGNVSNVRKTNKLSPVDPLYLTGNKKQEPCSSSGYDVSSSIDETKNIFGNFSHENKNKADKYNVATPKLQNQTKITKFATKAVKDTTKQRSPAGAIVIDDSPDRNANSSHSNRRRSAHVQENAMQREAQHKALDTVCEKPHLIQDKTLSINETDRQENISGDFLSQKDNNGVKKLSQRPTSSVSEILAHLKRNRESIAELLKSQLSSASVKQDSKKELTEDTVVISSDDDVKGKKESQVQTGQRRKSGLSMKTLGLKRSKSISLSQKQNSPADIKQSWKCNKQIVADSLNSSDSSQARILETVPALNDRRSSLSSEISYQGDIPIEDNAKKDSEIPNFVTMRSDTSVSSMPSLQRKQSSIYRNSSFEECSPPLLSQYPVQSPTSLHPPGVICLVDSPSPIKIVGNKPASDDVTSSESTMFTEGSVSGVDSHEDNLSGKLIDFLDIIDTTGDNQHSAGTTQCGADSKIDPLLKSSKPSYSETSASQVNTETDLKVAKKEDDGSALRGDEKIHLYSEIDKEICILDSEDEFYMNQSFDDTHCLKRQESEKNVKDGGENSLKRQESEKSVKDGGENSLKRQESEKSVKDGGENSLKRQESETSVKDGGENSSDVNIMDGQVLTESNCGDRTALNQLNENKEDSLENTSGYRTDAGQAVFEDGNNQNDLVPVVSTFKQHCEQKPSAAADYNVVFAVSPGGGCQTPDAFFAVGKEEIDDTAFTGAADASMYSEINDEIYILDSDDDEFFMTQSILNNPCSDKEEGGQNSTENERGSGMHEKFSLDLFEDEDKMTYNQQQSDNDKVFVKDMPGCSSAVDVNDDPAGFEIDSDENDGIFDDLIKETTPLALLPQENIDECCSEFAETGNIENGNEPCEVNEDDMAKNIIDDFNDDEDDEYFLSQMDTEIDYTTHSDEEFEDAEVECNEGGDGAVKSSRTDRNSPVTFDGLGTSLENQQCVENNSESSVSTCESGDTQDPFAMETQVCYPSVTNAQNEYNVATLPVSDMADDDAQVQINREIHATLEVTTKQNLCDKSPAVFSETPDQILQGGSKFPVSPLLNAEDTQDPFSLETQHHSDELMKEHDSREQRFLSASAKLHVQSVFTMETQECFERDDHVTNPYNQETQAVSPSSSDNSEYMFTSLQTQIIPEPEVNDRNKTDRETAGDSLSLRVDKQSLPVTATRDSFKLARNKQFKNDSHTSAVLLNEGVIQDQCDISRQEKDQQLADDDAFKEKTQVFSRGIELQSPYNIATQKNAQSDSSDDQALLNDDNTQDQFDLGARNHDHLLPSEEDNAYEGQTQVFSPGQELETTYDLATQTNVLSETEDHHGDRPLLNSDDTLDRFDIGTQISHQLPSEEDYAYAGQTQAFSPNKDSQRSYDIATQKNVPSESSGHPTAIILLSDDDTLDHFDFSTQVKDQVQSDDDYAYGGQTQAFSPNKDSQSSYDIATQKNVRTESSADPTAVILLNDQSEEDYTYGGQTQAFSPGKDSQSAYDIATQKNIPSEANNDHLFNIQTLADSALQDDATQNLFDEEAQKRPQSASNDNYIYEMQTLAHSPQEESESVYNMATQRQFESEDNGPGVQDRKQCLVLSSVDAVMQDPPKKKAKGNQQAVLEDRHLYEQETLARSQSPEIDDFYNMQTQNNFQLDRNNHTLSGKVMPVVSLDENTQDPSDFETRAVHLASEHRRHPGERDMLVSCQDEDCESSYSKATQNICQQERNSQSPYNRETLAMSPTVGEMLTVDKLEDSKSSRQSTTFGENLSPSSTVITHAPFECDTDFSSSEDQDGETFADSPSRRNIESHFLNQTQKALSPVREHSVSIRETAAVPTCSRGGDESSSDSECIFIMKTQKDSSPLATDQDPYTLQTQVVSSSFHEDTRDPFSVETQIDSPAGIEIGDPYDRKTLDILVVSEDSQDPFSLETELDTSSFEERSSVSRKTALATSSSRNKEVEINYVTEAQNNMSYLQTLIPHEKIAADLSVIGTDSRERQIQEDLTADVKSNVFFPAQDNLLKYLKDYTDVKDVKPFTPEPTGDPLLPGKAAQSNIGGNINCTQNKGSKVHDVQINAKISDKNSLPMANNILQSIGKNSPPRTSFIERLKLSISQKVQHPFKDDDNSSVQDLHSPYFAKGKQNSPSDKDANITESCGQSTPTRDALELSIQPRQNRFGTTIENSSHSEVYKKQSTSFQPNDSGLEGYVQKKVAVKDACDIGPLKDRFMPVNNSAKNVFSSQSEMLPKELPAPDGCITKGTSSSTHPLQQDLTHQCHKEKVAGLSERNPASVKRPAENSNETSSKRKCVPKDVGTEDSYGIAGKKRSKEKEHNILSDSKRIKVIPAEYRISENKWITVRKGNNLDAKHNKATTVTKNTSKLKRPRRKIETTKGTLTSQVESAKKMLENRRMEAQSFQPVNDKKVKILANDDNDDVVMPSTQDMMSLGLPILSAKLPVSKRHLASGLPSQGRVASDDNKLQDKNKPGSSQNQLNGFCSRKNSIQKDILPSVPLFCSLTESKNISSCTSSPFTPAQSAVTLETPASSITSSKESKESSLGPSLVITNCHTASGSEPAKLITQTHSAVIQPVCSTSETSATETVQTSSAMSAQSEVSVDPRRVYLIPALVSETVYPNGLALPTLQGTSKQAANTKWDHQGILKGSKPPKLNLYGEKAAPKVTFKDPHHDCSSLQRREVALPQADVSQLKEIPKCRPEAKLYFLSTLLHWNPVWLQEKEVIQCLPALFGSQNKVEDVCCQLRMYYSRFHEYVDITLNLLILECWETIYKDWKMCRLRSPVTLEVHCTRSPWQLYKEKEGQSLVCIEVAGLVTQQNRFIIPSVGDLVIMNFWGARKLQKTYDEPRWCTQFAYVRSVSLQNDIRQFMQTYRIFESSPAWRDRGAIAVNITLILQHRGVVIVPTKLHKIQVISSLKTIDRQIDALVNLPESPLCTQLLKPTPGGLFTYRNMQPDTKLLSQLNKEQACSVATIVQDVKDSPRSQKMFLLQGPPGTGKSHTMLVLIHQILRVTNFKGRICLAAPSNAAVDEMAKRIINFSHKLKRSALEGISLVRVGNKSRVHPAVKSFMWEDLVENILSKDIPDSLKSELSALENEALKLEKALSDQSLPQEQKVVRSRKQKEIKAKIFKLKADMARKKKNVRERYNARCSVLDKAQIICGTLSSLGSEDLKEIVLRTEENPHKKLPFTCLIIDEATQAIEVDCLIPLQYKMNKVVLVGDTEQLPATVLSQMASEKQLARSLFERMDFCIKQFAETSKSPVMMLTRQYRMHNEILCLPNSFFYEGQLVTDESVLARKELIAPYLVFDIKESKEARGANTRSVSNEEEAICIAQLCEVVSKRIDKIGVICPYTDQQQSILACLRQRNLTVEVNTVDSFQGQEREVIILSCVRAQSNPSSIGFLSDRKRMNVALTRAKLALYVIGHFETLKTDELWEQLYQNAVTRNLLVNVHKTSDFKLLAENAVCRVKNYSASGS